MNQRIILIILLVLFTVIFICVGLLAAYIPRFQDRLGEINITRTQIAIDAVRTANAQATQHALQTEAAAKATQHMVQTLTAMPTFTPTPTLTPTPTATPTSTVAPPPIACAARVTGTDREMYEVPGGGRQAKTILLKRGTDVEVLARLTDLGWYQVRWGDTTGWLRSDFVRFMAACTPNTYYLSHLLGRLREDNRLVLEEPFASNSSNWLDEAGEPIFYELTDYGESQMLVSAANRLVVARSDTLSNLKAFELVMSLYRSNSTNDSYVGLRFRSQGESYYEMRILRDCSVEVYATEELIFPIKIDPGENNCGDQSPDYIEVSLNEDYELIFQINDSDPKLVTLPDPDGRYSNGSVELIASGVRAAWDFVVVTAPR